MVVHIGACPNKAVLWGDQAVQGVMVVEGKDLQVMHEERKGKRDVRNVYNHTGLHSSQF